jgi:hypothetical protein
MRASAAWKAARRMPRGERRRRSDKPGPKPSSGQKTIRFYEVRHGGFRARACRRQHLSQRASARALHPDGRKARVQVHRTAYAEDRRVPALQGRPQFQLVRRQGSQVHHHPAGRCRQVRRNGRRCPSRSVRSLAGRGPEGSPTSVAALFAGTSAAPSAVTFNSSRKASRRCGGSPGPASIGKLRPGVRGVRSRNGVFEEPRGPRSRFGEEWRERFGIRESLRHSRASGLAG